MQGKKKRNKSICPICGKKFESVDVFEYTGPAEFQPRFCKVCRRGVDVNGDDYKNYQDKQPSGIQTLSESRGLPVEENKRRAVQLELDGRRFREKYGVKAPANWDFVFDSYDGRFGGIY